LFGPGIGPMETGGAWDEQSVQDPPREVWEAFKVDANQGAAGVGRTVDGRVEANLAGNLTALENRLSGRELLSSPVRRVEFQRRMAEATLGIRRLPDCIAQEVVRRYLSRSLSRRFHADFLWLRARANRAVRSVHKARQRGWRYDGARSRHSGLLR